MLLPIVTLGILVSEGRTHWSLKTRFFEPSWTRISMRLKEEIENRIGTFEGSVSSAIENSNEAIVKACEDLVIDCIEQVGSDI